MWLILENGYFILKFYLEEDLNYTLAKRPWTIFFTIILLYKNEFWVLVLKSTIHFALQFGYKCMVYLLNGMILRSFLVLLRNLVIL